VKFVFLIKILLVDTTLIFLLDSSLKIYLHDTTYLFL